MAAAAARRAAHHSLVGADVVIVGALGLFALTLRLNQAAYLGYFRPPASVISGTADGARQILTSIAASVITVVGIVLSITTVMLTLGFTQFGSPMLCNFIRDPASS